MGTIYYKGTAYGSGSNDSLKLIDFDTWLRNNYSTEEERQAFIDSFNSGNEIALEAEDNKIIIPFDNSYFLASAAIINGNNSDLVYTEETEQIDVPLDNGMTGYYGDFKNAIVIQGLRSLHAPHSYSNVQYSSCPVSSLMACYALTGELESLIDSVDDGVYSINGTNYTFSNGDKTILSMLQKLLNSGDITKYIYSAFELEVDYKKYLMQFLKESEESGGTKHTLFITRTNNNDWVQWGNFTSPTTDIRISTITFTEQVDIAGVIPIAYEITYNYDDKTQGVGYFTLVDGTPTEISASTSELKYPTTAIKLYLMPIGLVKKEDGSYRTASFTKHSGTTSNARRNMQIATLNVHFKTNKERDFSNALQIKQQPINWKEYLKTHYGIE